MPKETVFENDYDYHCATCNHVYLHDDQKLMMHIDTYRMLFPDRQNVTSGFCCSANCSMDWLLTRMEEYGHTEESGLERHYNRQVMDYVSRLENGGNKHET